MRGQLAIRGRCHVRRAPIVEVATEQALPDFLLARRILDLALRERDVSKAFFGVTSNSRPMP
jgi:hypothetical protein